MEIDEVAESEPEEEGEDEQQSLIWASAPNIGHCEGVHIAKSLFRPCVNHWLTRSGETFNFQRTGIVIYNSPSYKLQVQRDGIISLRVLRAHDRMDQDNVTQYAHDPHVHLLAEAGHVGCSIGDWLINV